MGRRKADLVVKDATLVNVHSRELVEGVDVAVKDGRIALVGEAGHTIGSRTTVVNADGKYVTPGFLDGHVHVESSMLTLTQFARAVLPHGTTTVFIDPHEIANVLGLEGVKLSLKESQNLPLKVYVCVPSCVPAAPSFETTGAMITLKDVEEALLWEGVIGLGEVMNYPAVLGGDEEMHAKIRAALKAGKVVEGHADGILDTELAAYAAAGITSCHESTMAIEGMQKLRLGMCLMIREASAWRDLAEVVKCITERGLDPRHTVLVTDDRHVETLLSEGHVDDVVQKAIEEGVDPVVAVQMATLNTAEHFGLSQEIGSVAPGRAADVLILDSLTKVKVNTVIVDGFPVAREGRLTIGLASPEYPRFVRETVRLRRPVTAEDFAVKAPFREGLIRTRVIGIVEGEAFTRNLKEELAVKDWLVQPDVQRDVVKVAVVERHKGTGNIGLGFVKGFGLREGAVASSVAHDSHNIVSVGADGGDISLAVNKLAEVGGGLIAVKRGEVLALVELPLAGLMSEKTAENVYEDFKKLRGAWAELGCRTFSTFMTIPFLALPVLPELRITDKGLVDTREFHFVPLFTN